MTSVTPPVSGPFFTADTHFGHQKLLGYEERPFADLETMHAELIRRWNSVVQPTDTIFHLGDVMLMDYRKARPFLDQCNGIKILVRGNHDRKPDCFRLGFHAVLEEAQMHVPGLGLCVLSHIPLVELPHGVEANLHGHMHSRDLESKRHLCVSVERTDYYPVSAARIVRMLHLKRKHPRNL